MNNMHMVSNRKGVALIVVILIILAITAIALVALKTSQYDDRMSQAFIYNRQAQNAAHAAAIGVEVAISEDPNKFLTECVDDGTGTEHNVKIPHSAIEPFSGLATTPPDTSNKDRLKGDLARFVGQMGVVNDISLSSSPVAGFSNGNAFCKYVATAESQALVGPALIVHTTEGDDPTKFYVLSELNAALSGFKREIGAMNVEPLTCNLQ